MLGQFEPRQRAYQYLNLGRTVTDGFSNVPGLGSSKGRFEVLTREVKDSRMQATANVMAIMGAEDASYDPVNSSCFLQIYHSQISNLRAHELLCCLSNTGIKDADHNKRFWHCKSAPVAQPAWRSRIRSYVRILVLLVHANAVDRAIAYVVS